MVMSCRTSSYFSSIESAIRSLSFFLYESRSKARDLAGDLVLLAQQRILAAVHGGGDALAQRGQARLELQAAELTDTIGGADAARGRRLHGHFRHDPSRVLVWQALQQGSRADGAARGGQPLGRGQHVPGAQAREALVRQRL